jgi:hypothetical protein
MATTDQGTTRGVGSRRGRAGALATAFERIGGHTTKGRTKADRIWLGFWFGLAILLLGFLVGPRVIDSEQKSTCVGNVELLDPFGISLNCDSPQFMWLARDPSGLLMEENPRQARPGMILAAALLTAPLSFVAPPGGPSQIVDTGIQNPAEITASFARDLPAYLAYVLLNVALLGASFLVLRKILDGAGTGARNPSMPETIIVVSAGLLLIANDVTKAFVWSPHTQMFNMLVPVLAVYGTLRTWSGELADWRFAGGLGAAVGLGMTAYPVFVVIPVCCALPAVVRIARTRSRSVRRRSAAGLALLLALSVAPSLLWYLFVRATTGSFFHFEMAQGEVVWMSYAWGKGAGVLLRDWLSNAWVLFAAAVPQALAIIAVAALTAGAVLWKGASLRPVYPVLIAGVYVSLAVLGFYTSVGWIVDRLAYPIVPPLLVALAAAALAVSRQLDVRNRWNFAAGIAILTVVQIVYEIAKDGPWS